MGIKLCLHRLGLRCRDVAPEEQGQPLGLLLGLEGFGPGESAAPFSEEMLVMHGLSPARFNALLDALRREGLRVALEEVVTETNVAWSSGGCTGSSPRSTRPCSAAAAACIKTERGA